MCGNNRWQWTHACSLLIYDLELINSNTFEIWRHVPMYVFLHKIQRTNIRFVDLTAFCCFLFADAGIFWLGLVLRTLITGMVSGSIVAFNIDFNRWHHEHQNKYWAGTDPGGGRRARRGREKRLPTSDRGGVTDGPQGLDQTQLGWRTSAWWRCAYTCSVWAEPVAEHVFCWVSCTSQNIPPAKSSRSLLRREELIKNNTNIIM